MTILQDILAALGWQTRVNENFRSTAPAALYGIDPATTNGLTLGYLGGEFNGVTVANGTIVLTASATNYVVAHRTTGAVTAATNTTNWLDTTTYLRLYQLVAGAAAFTIAATSDKRQAFGGAGGAGSGMSNPMTAVGDIIVGGAVTGGVAAPTRMGMGSALQVVRVNAAGTALEYGTPAGAGDVVGPSGVVADRIAVFDGTTGKLLKDGGKTVAGLRSPSIQSVTSSATVTPTFADDMVKITAQAAGLTLANPTGTAIDGLGIVIRIKDNGTTRSIAYGTQYRAIGVTLPTATAVGKTLYLAMVFNNDDTKWDVVAVGQEA